MSVQQPTTQELTAIIVAQLEAAFSQTIPLLPKSFLRVLAKVLAGVFVMLYKYGAFIFLQQFVSTASTRETVINGRTLIPLVELGRLIGIGDPVAATQAELLIDVTVENQTGFLDSGSQLVKDATGVTYITLGSVALSAPVVQVTGRAVADQSGGDGSGAIGNLPPGDTLSFANPLPNVAREAVVNAQTVTGSDAESWDAYRQRILDKFQKQPQGGAYADYEIWGEEPAGIISVYPYTSDCPGQIDLYVEATPESSGDPDGIPTTAQLQEVLDSVELDDAGRATRKPAGALVNAYPITRTGFDIEISGLSVSDPSAVLVDITAAVEDYFLGRAPYIVGVSVPPRTDRISQTAVAGVVDTVVSSAGGIFSSVTLKLGGITLLLYTLGIGEKSKAASVTLV